MRGTKVRNKNLRYGKELKRKMRCFGIDYYDFHQLDGYFVFSFPSKSVIHFSVGDYKFGVWLDQKKIFAEHLGNIDKFKWTATHWSRDLEGMGSIINLVREVLAYEGEEYEGSETDLMRWQEYLKEEEEGKRQMVLVDLDYFHKIKNLNPNFKEVWISNRFNDVQWTQLNIVLKENVSDGEFKEINDSINTLCDPIYYMEHSWVSKIYQSVLNGSINWFVSAQK